MKVIAVSQERRNEMRQRITKYRGVGLARLVMTLMVMGMPRMPERGATS